MLKKWFTIGGVIIGLIILILLFFSPPMCDPCTNVQLFNNSNSDIVLTIRLDTADLKKNDPHYSPNSFFNYYQQDSSCPTQLIDSARYIGKFLIPKGKRFQITEGLSYQNSFHIDYLKIEYNGKVQEYKSKEDVMDAFSHDTGCLYELEIK